MFFRVQEIDGSYFESFTTLAWKQENQRQSVLKSAETSASEPPPPEIELGINPIDYSAQQNEKDKLYVEMLYTIANAVRQKFNSTSTAYVPSSVSLDCSLYFRWRLVPARNCPFNLAAIEDVVNRIRFWVVVSTNSQLSLIQMLI